MGRNYEVITFISKYIYFKKARAASFDDIIKIAIIFIKTTFEDSKKLKELQIILYYENI